MFFCVFLNVVFLLLLKQNYKYDAFLMGKDSISWTQRVFCSSIIDFIWFVFTVLLTWMDTVVKCFMRIFNVFYKSEKHVLCFLICKSMFLTSMVLRRDCFKIDGDAYTVSGIDVVHGLWFLTIKSYVDIRRGSLVRWWQMRVQSSKMRVFSFDRYMFSMKFPTGFTHRKYYTASRGFPATARLLLGDFWLSLL